MIRVQAVKKQVFTENILNIYTDLFILTNSYYINLDVFNMFLICI